MAPPLLFLLLLLLAAECSNVAVGTFVGLSLGSMAAQQRPEAAVELLRSMGVRQVRLYGAEPEVLNAFAGSGIGVLLGVPNNHLRSLAASPATAADWLRRYVTPFLPNTHVTGIVVGDAVASALPTALPALLPAMRHLHHALLRQGPNAGGRGPNPEGGSQGPRSDNEAPSPGGLDQGPGPGDQDAQGPSPSGTAGIVVTTAVSTGQLLGAFPPSHAFFNDSLHVMQPLLRFLAAAGSPLLLDVDAMAAFRAAAGSAPLGYALFQDEEGSSSGGGGGFVAVDSSTGLNYTNLFDALLDAAYAAMAKLGHPDDVPLVVGATGWPWSAGGAADDVATVANSARYNRNLVSHVLRRRGTPLKPAASVPTYIHQLYDDGAGSSGATGLTSAGSWGLFAANNRTPVYRLDVTGVSLAERPIKQWCVAKPGAVDRLLDSALNWACGAGGADCRPIQPGGACFLPDAVSSHASFAFNSYFQRNIQGDGTCDFNGCAQLTSLDPSYGNCLYSSSSSGTANLDSPGNSSSLSPDSTSSASLRRRVPFTTLAVGILSVLVVV